jgi:hypothetical protein
MTTRLVANEYLQDVEGIFKYYCSIFLKSQKRNNEITQTVELVTGPRSEPVHPQYKDGVFLIT